MGVEAQGRYWMSSRTTSRFYISRIIFNIIYVSMYFPVWVCYRFVHPSSSSLEECEPMEGVCCLTWVLGTKVRFFGGAPSAPNHWVISPVSIPLSLKAESLPESRTHQWGQWVVNELSESACFYPTLSIINVLVDMPSFFFWFGNLKLRFVYSLGKYFSDSHFLAQGLIFFSFEGHLQNYETPILLPLTL